MYRIDGELYESLCSALMENDCDDTIQFDEWLNKNYTASKLLASYESNGRKWYHNLVDWVNEDLYTDFLNEMSNDDDFLAEFDIEKVEDDEDV
jgi:hypothetical protein